MTISRKPVGPSYDASHARPPPDQLHRRDSWEVYSSDEDEPLDITSTSRNQDYVPYRPPGPQQPGGVLSDDAQPQDGDLSKLDQIPSSLRPGGAQAQTNPFLRKKVPEPSDAPAERLAKLSMGDSTSHAYPYQQPLTAGTTTSSNYDTPPTTVVSESNPWSTENPAQPGRSYSPASTTLLQHSADPTHQPSLLRSPVDIGQDVWSDPSRSSPQPPHYPAPVAPPNEGNPWATEANVSAPPQPPSPPPPVPGSEPPSQPLAPQQPPVPQPPPKAPEIIQPQYTNAAASLEVPKTDVSRPSTPGYSDSNPFTHGSSPGMVSALSEDGSGFVNVPKDQENTSQTQYLNPVPTGSSSNQNVWEDLDALDRSSASNGNAATSQIEEWKLVDVDSQAPEESTGQPPLPARPESGDHSRFVPPRSPVDPKSETYQVKNINWHDPQSAQTQRVSPILVQNENGPCPLVALVNALSLTTPPDANDTSLVEVLRSREQISLNLLLDAVFEELMSPRRLDEDVTLPDVSELYAFLMSLHTGMNVNPRFIPSAGIREAYERTSLTHLDTADRASLIPGTFENTHEMSLYATFKIPLIHGWLPSPEDDASDALERRAHSYEDAQNMMFHEEEFEHKLSNEGLSSEEQDQYQDLITIKSFLETSATQLTAWGIQVISKAIRPGTFAILFRNDHFSTLYCHPQSKELVTLVTDDGYRANDEVVWESLVDISGQHTQYLSGDFRVVGSGASTTFDGYSDSQAGEWTTVEGRRGRPGQSSTEEAPLSPAEQEDRDLALAMQLQEEEDQRHREEQDRRQRNQNQETANQYLQGRPQSSRSPPSSSRYPGAGAPRPGGPQGLAPARTSSTSNPRPVMSNLTEPRQGGSRPLSQNIRPMVPPRRNVPNTHRPEVAGADAPPPYEQAAQDELFEPPVGHPAHSTSTNTSQQSGSANNGPAPPRLGQRMPGQIPAAFQGRPNPAMASGRERDRDCVVM